MERTELPVEGMACDGCEETVENALGAVDGVRRVDADHESDAVEVVADGIDEETLARTVREAGYDVPA